MTNKVCGQQGYVGKDAQGCLLLSGSKDGQGMVLDSNNNVYVPAGDFEVSQGNLEVPNGNLKVFDHVNITNGALNVLNGSLSVSGNSNLNGPVEVSNGDLKVTSGCFTAPQQPFFSASLSSNKMGQTGDGALAKFIPDTVSYNIGGGYNSSSGDFTAPKTGLYWLACKIAVGVDRGIKSDLYERLRLTVASQINIKYWLNTKYDDDFFATREMSGAFYMNTGDVANCEIVIQQVGQNAAFFGGSPSFQMSVFSGHLLH